MSKKKNRLTKHHLTPKSMVANRELRNRPENLIRIPGRMHNAYHDLFGLKSLQESIESLRKLQKSGVEITRYNIFIIYITVVKLFLENGHTSYLVLFTTWIIEIAKEQESYFVLFGESTVAEAINFLETWKVGNYKKVRRRPPNRK